MIQFPETALPALPTSQRLAFDVDWLRASSGFSKKSGAGKNATTQKSLSVRSWEPSQELLAEFEESLTTGINTKKKKNG